jgi:hypothetical protein
MKFSRWVIILLALFSVAIMVSVALLGWDANLTMQSMRSSWRGPYHPEFEFPMDVPPLVSGLTSMGTIFLLGVIILFLIPKRIAKMSRALQQSPSKLLRYLFLGILSGVLLGTIAISSALTFVTFPMTIILGIALLISSFFGSIALYFSVGSTLLRRADWGAASPLYGLLLGVTILHPLVYIPYLGEVLKIVYASLGLGLVIATRLGGGGVWSLHTLTEPGRNFTVENSKEQTGNKE